MDWETQYRELLMEIISNGEEVETRNGIRISLMNKQLTADLSKGFPILTGRYIPFEKIVEEFLWFLRGQTDAKILDSKGVKIWNSNSSREYLDSRGLTNFVEGDIGPGYGYQLRYAGKKYKDDNEVGKDQWKEVINLLRTDPTSTRIIFSFWDAKQIDQMALPPCHILYQFLIRGGKLHCTFYQRSWDVLLGWNMSTASLFTLALSRIIGIPAGTVTHMIADLHIYKIHKSNAMLYLSSELHPLPMIEIDKDIDLENVSDSVSAQNFRLIDYKYTSKINFKLVA